MLSKICGKYVPGRFHANTVVRETSWAKIIGWNAFEEGALYLKNMDRLIEAEKAAWDANREETDHPHLEEANRLHQEATDIGTEEPEQVLRRLIKLS